MNFDPIKLGTLRVQLNAHAIGTEPRIIAEVTSADLHSIETMSADELRHFGMQAILAADCADQQARRARRKAA